MPPELTLGLVLGMTLNCLMLPGRRLGWWHQIGEIPGHRTGETAGADVLIRRPPMPR
jgi:hypothetical protein